MKENTTPKLPVGAVLLGKGGTFKTIGLFIGWVFNPKTMEAWEIDRLYGDDSNLIYAAPADSEVARLNAPEPVTGEEPHCFVCKRPVVPNVPRLGFSAGAVHADDLTHLCVIPAPPPAGAKGEPVSDPYKLETQEHKAISTLERMANTPGVGNDMVLWNEHANAVIDCAGELAEAKRKLSSMTADRDSWEQQADQRTQDFVDANQEIAKLRAELDGARKESFERAAQICRYYLKHQDQPSRWDDQSEYEKGITIACGNLEKLMLDELPAPSSGQVTENQTKP